MIEEQLGAFKNSRQQVLVVFTPSVDGVLSEVQTHIDYKRTAFTQVTYSSDQIPKLRTLLKELVGSLAQCALAIYPYWYRGNDSDQDSEGCLKPGEMERILSCLKAKDRSLPWAKLAGNYCQAGELPIPRGFRLSVHARQLALAIHAHSILITLIVHDSDQEGNPLLGLARAVEWLAGNTEAKILVILPEKLQSRIELDSITSNSIDVVPGTQHSLTSVPNERKSILWPIEGEPHPFSPGEQKLAVYLSEDDELSGMFAFNQRVKTRFGSVFLVDLLSATGRLVIEIDGYQFHRNETAFSLDRHRDYELMVSGYRVLRITHHEVVADIKATLEKIRTFVRFFQN